MNVFLSVGTQKFPFDRIVRLVGNLNESGNDLIIFGQIGTTNIKPSFQEYVKFLDSDSFEKRLRWSDVVITHGGVGTIIKALKLDKKVIVIPRLSKYGEHVDDHQVQIASTFERTNYLIAYREEDSLEELVKNAQERVFNKYVSNRKYVIDTIDSFIRVIL